MGKRKASSQSWKTKFRSSNEWKKWRHQVYVKDGGIDFITGKKLISGCNCHHEDLREENYKKLEDTNRFRMLNKLTHKMIHWLFPYWLKDKEIISRITKVLEEMEKFSND